AGELRHGDLPGRQSLSYAPDADPFMTEFRKVLDAATPVTIGGVPDGAEAFVLADIAGAAFAAGADLPALAVYVARDGQRQQLIEQALDFAAPEVEVLSLPAWDCQPYDRTSPNA